MVRPARNWLVGASYLAYATQGVVSRTDSSFYIPPYWEGFFFFAYPVAGHTTLFGDLVSIEQRVKAGELFVGASIPCRRPRKLVHVNASAVSGMRASVVRERHGYQFNTRGVDSFHPVGGPYDAAVEVQGTVWAWFLRLRADLHCGRFVSLFTELTVLQQVAAPDLGSTASQGAETMRVPDRRGDASGVNGSFGISLHL
jgi:hypothetical protein